MRRFARGALVGVLIPAASVVAEGRPVASEVALEAPPVAVAGSAQTPMLIPEGGTRSPGAEAAGVTGHTNAAQAELTVPRAVVAVGAAIVALVVVARSRRPHS